jgi:hypothetical protein
MVKFVVVIVVGQGIGVDVFLRSNGVVNFAQFVEEDVGRASNHVVFVRVGNERVVALTPTWEFEFKSNPSRVTSNRQVQKDLSF